MTIQRIPMHEHNAEIKALAVKRVNADHNMPPMWSRGLEQVAGGPALATRLRRHKSRVESI
jgi:hypothetical protein